MDNNLSGVYEYLFTNKSLLKEGDLPAGEAQTLKERLRTFLPYSVKTTWMKTTPVKMSTRHSIRGMALRMVARNESLDYCTLQSRGFTSFHP